MQTRVFEKPRRVDAPAHKIKALLFSQTILETVFSVRDLLNEFREGPKHGTTQPWCAMLIGYARVSTQDQNLELQIDALTKAGCLRLFDDKMSGSRAERPGLAKALDMLREGDTLVVWKLDRLGRSVKNLVDLVGQLRTQGVQFKSLTDAIDTGTPSGRFFFHVMASLAEMERELIVERTRAGLDVARKLGRKGGRKPKMTASKIESAKKLLASGVPPQGRSQEPRRVRSDAVPLGACLRARLAYDFFRFLKRPPVVLAELRVAVGSLPGVLGGVLLPKQHQRHALRRNSWWMRS